MINQLAHFWHDLPTFIRLPLDFAFTVIFIRGIIAKEIMDFLKEKGVLKEGVLHALYHLLKKVVPNLERHIAIWNHYKLQRQGDAHDGFVAVCEQDRCVVFAKR
jgi:hypothetical protein